MRPKSPYGITICGPIEGREPTTNDFIEGEYLFKIVQVIEEIFDDPFLPQRDVPKCKSALDAYTGCLKAAAPDIPKMMASDHIWRDWLYSLDNWMEWIIECRSIVETVNSVFKREKYTFPDLVFQEDCHPEDGQNPFDEMSDEEKKEMSKALLDWKNSIR